MQPANSQAYLHRGHLQVQHQASRVLCSVLGPASDACSTRSILTLSCLGLDMIAHLSLLQMPAVRVQDACLRPPFHVFVYCRQLWADPKQHWRISLVPLRMTGLWQPALTPGLPALNDLCIALAQDLVVSHLLVASQLMAVVAWTRGSCVRRKAKCSVCSMLTSQMPHTAPIACLPQQMLPTTTKDMLQLHWLSAADTDSGMSLYSSCCNTGSAAPMSTQSFRIV